MFLLEFQKGIQRRLESQKEKKRNEKNLNPPQGFCITFRIPKGNSNLTQAKKKRKERRKLKKVGFYNINLYFRGIISLRKKINDFSWLQQLHKSQTPLLALSRGKTIDKEKKRTLLDIVSQKKERQRLLLKEKENKIGGELVSKKKKWFTCEPKFSWREEIEASFPVL